MKVKAIRDGYYNHKRRRAGEVFDLIEGKVKNDKGEEEILSAEKQFSKIWMKKIEIKRYVEVDEEIDSEGEEPKQKGKKKMKTGDELKSVSDQDVI